MGKIKFQKSGTISRPVLIGCTENFQQILNNCINKLLVRYLKKHEILFYYITRFCFLRQKKSEQKKQLDDGRGLFPNSAPLAVSVCSTVSQHNICDTHFNTAQKYNTVKSVQSGKSSHLNARALFVSVPLIFKGAAIEGLSNRVAIYQTLR